MRVINETSYRTADIAAIVRKAIRPWRSKEQMRLYQVRVVWGRESWDGVGGHAPYHGNRMQLSLTRGRATAEVVAATAVHEVWHNRGVSHGDMPDPIRWCHTINEDKSPRYPWAVDMPLRLVEKKSKAKPPAADRAVHAHEKAQEWERKAKIATARARRWRQKAKRIEYGIKRAAKP